ncbi:MAG TPA: ABC transporter permease [Myxococcales bacterium]|jgi:peptide/nickel transport system permease protein|nr:ABC transporter permease [Myxococcales bacterium]
MTEQDTHMMQSEPEDMTFLDIVWGQFKKNRMAYAAMWLVVVLFLLAVYAPVIASERPFIWQDSEGTYFPWFSSLFDHNYYENGVDKFFNLLLILGTPLFVVWWFMLRSTQKSGLEKRLRRQKIRKFSSVMVIGFLVVFLGVILTQSGQVNRYNFDSYEAAKAEGKAVSALFPPIAYTYSKQSLEEKLQQPNAKHIMGTDRKGRDVAVRILFGTRISLSVGVIAVGIYVTIGIFLGAFAGFFRGRVDMIIQRVIEIFMSVPTLIVLLVMISFIEKPSIFHIMVVIGLFRWTGVARLVRGEFYRLRNLDFVTSAIALGYSNRRIIFQHILPNALGPVLVAATFGVAAAILLESSLSFLGLGDISVPSWGQTLNAGYKTGEWYLIMIPGIAIFITVTLLNLIGEGLRDALDPKMRK